MSKKRGLAAGRGLNALLGNIKQAQAAVDQQEYAAEHTQELPVELLKRGKYQPRRDFSDEALNELAESIKRHGVMQPIVVRRLALEEDTSAEYEIVAGERRWRAARLAGLATIPVIIKDINDETAIALALIENIQREDLNAIEQAYALQRFAEEFGLNHQQIADTVGKARATVSNLMRLLALNDEVKTMLEHGDLDMGHARTLLSLPVYQQTEVARQIVARGLTVRQSEQLVRGLLEPKQTKNAVVVTDTKRLSERLSSILGQPVEIAHNAQGKGKMVIRYHSNDELENVLARLNVNVSDEE